MTITKHVHRRKICLLIISTLLFFTTVLVFWFLFDHSPRVQYQFTFVSKATSQRRSWQVQDWVQRYNITHLFDWTWHRTGDYNRCHIPPNSISKLIPQKLNSTIVVHDVVSYFRSHSDEGCIVDNAPHQPNPVPHPIPRARNWSDTCASMNIDRHWILCYLPQSEIGKYLPTTTHHVVVATFNAYVDKGHCNIEVPGTVFTEHATFHPQGWVNAPCSVDPITRLPMVKPKNRYIELIDSIGVYLHAPGHFGPQQLPRLLRLLAVAPTTTKVLVAKGGVADLLMDVLIERDVVTRDRIVLFDKKNRDDYYANIVYRSESWPYLWNQSYAHRLHDRTDMQLAHRVLVGDNNHQQSIDKKDHVILIKRKDGYDRSLIEHSDVAAFMISALEKSNLSSNLHFKVFTAQGHMRDHIALFHRARIIVGPHGAGMMNILWASPKTYVVEIGYSTGMTFPQMYAEMSLHLDQNYWVCKGHGAYGAPIHIDMNDFINNEMDVDKIGVVDEEGEQQSAKGQLIGLITKTIRLYLDDVFEIIFSNDRIVNNPMDQLQEFANKFNLNFYIYIIQKDERRFQEIISSTVHETNNHDPNIEHEVMFRMDDMNSMQLFQEVVSNQYPDSTVNVVQSSECKLNASNLCNLLLQNVQSLISCVGSQLDHFNKFSFASSAYQLAENDFTSLETMNNALDKQLNLLLRLSELTAETLKINRITSISTDITEATSIVRDTSITNHDENILTNNPVDISPDIPLNGQLSITTDNGEQTIQLPKVQLLNQPARVRRHRYLVELRDGNCSGIPFQFTLPKEINNYKRDFYLGAHVTTYDGKEHDQKIPVYTDISIKENYNLKTNDLDCFETSNDHQDKNETFDRKTKGVFSKIIFSDQESLQKSWTFKTVNLCQDNTITKTLIKVKKLKWCRFKFAIYIKSSVGHFQQISPPVYSDLCQETSNGHPIETDTIIPDKLCENGGQMIFIAIDENLNKDGEDNLTIEVRNLTGDFLVSHQLLYHQHGDHPDPCAQLINTTFMKFSITDHLAIEIDAPFFNDRAPSDRWIDNKE
ncbi:hypothetical protein I4U23_012365 [Adineta vaga]|nr:hypothetical protein I4U23_012365 [Adineta vaga]